MSDTWQWDAAGKMQQKFKSARTEMIMIRWTCEFTLTDKCRLKEMLDTEPSSLVIRNSRLRWSGQVDINWIKPSTAMETATYLLMKIRINFIIFKF